MKSLLLLSLLALLTAAIGAADIAAPQGVCPATEQPLGFWLGHWDVYAAGKLDGHNFVESTLDGCAVIEHWDDVSGFKGMSLFYFEPHAQLWKQVWVTDHAHRPGGLKEKTLIHAGVDSTRFQGSVWTAPDRMILDRTTLHKLDDGNVSQVIEFSRDGGTSWTTAYDAVYRRAAVPGGDIHP